MTNKFNSGLWHKVTMTVGGANPPEIGFIEIDVDGTIDYSRRSLQFKLKDEVNIGGLLCFNLCFPTGSRMPLSDDAICRIRLNSSSLFILLSSFWIRLCQTFLPSQIPAKLSQLSMTKCQRLNLPRFVLRLMTLSSLSSQSITVKLCPSLPLLANPIPIRLNPLPFPSTSPTAD